MENEFDNEIDALLRGAMRSGETLRSTDSGEHLDADEIVIFAENALPEKAKPRVVKHLADCDRCRTILSNTVILNKEADEEVASAPVASDVRKTVIAASAPWYRSLFATRNLAFGMGGLAIIFAGMLGFFVIQNSMVSNKSEVAQVSDSELPANRAAELRQSEETLANTNAADPEAIDLKDSDVAATPVAPLDIESDNVNGPNPGGVDRKQPDGDAKSNRENKSDKIQDKSTDSDVAKRTDEPLAEESEVADEVKDAAPGRKLRASRKERVGNASATPAAAKRAGSRSAPKPARAKPSIMEQPKSETAGAERRKRKSDISADSVETYSKKSIATRKINGKTFTRKNRVWYDSKYRGQKTTNIKRGTSAYKNLDSGVRTIAKKLGGTVVLVWKSKAYRID